ncbi:MAG: class I SAM-dependent methyltransferase [Terracidiphilus sp.]|jgi:predicted O-methyltransferase YrrM
MKLSTVFLGSLSIVSLLRKIKGLQECASPNELVEIAMECPAIRPQQCTTEFLELVNLVKAQQCKYILEIGTYKGGTLFVFSQSAAADATVISIDLSMTFIGNLYRACQAPLFRRFIRKGQSLFLMRKDSHQPETLANIKKVLQGRNLDFLFIDGDHRYEGVRMDFGMYSPLVRKGGLIAFHDIAQSEGPEEVYKFWDEIKQSYIHKEFVHHPGQKAMGIGVLWV